MPTTTEQPKPEPILATWFQCNSCGTRTRFSMQGIRTRALRECLEPHCTIAKHSPETVTVFNAHDKKLNHKKHLNEKSLFAFFLNRKKEKDGIEASLECDILRIDFGKNLDASRSIIHNEIHGESDLAKQAKHFACWRERKQKKRSTKKAKKITDHEQYHEDRDDSEDGKEDKEDEENEKDEKNEEDEEDGGDEDDNEDLERHLQNHEKGVFYEDLGVVELPTTPPPEPQDCTKSEDPEGLPDVKALHDHDMGEIWKPAGEPGEPNKTEIPAKLRQIEPLGNTENLNDPSLEELIKTTLDKEAPDLEMVDQFY